MYEMNHEQLVHIIRSPRSGKNYMRPPFSLYQVPKSPFIDTNTVLMYHHKQLQFIIFVTIITICIFCL